MGIHQVPKLTSFSPQQQESQPKAHASKAQRQKGSLQAQVVRAGRCCRSRGVAWEPRCQRSPVQLLEEHDDWLSLMTSHMLLLLRMKTLPEPWTARAVDS